MSLEQINVTLGTAGHIDHGKTALVKSLTGCETDRLKEEKERGMSIDLGFAPCQIADGQVGIVDVPGHENFIKTMVAGASGMDGVILVVAADDGVMPQTREHLDILTLLGLRHGLVALTKIDRVDADHLELAQAELADFLRGTFLENAPILPLSNVTGQGFDAFLEALLALIGSIKPKRIDGVFRLPLERAFSVKGFGTVIAGIPVAGSAGVDDELIVLPAGTTGRIRRIEVYGRPSDRVLAGQCAAINVGQWGHHGMRRGDVVTLPGYFSPQSWYACTLRLLPRDKLLLKNGAQVKFHTGTSEVPAAVYSVEGAHMQGGGDYLVQVRTQEPIVAGPGDHYILRTLSPVRTVGGGMIIEATERRLKRSQPDVCEDLRARAQAAQDETQFVEYCVRTAPALAASEAEIAARAKVPRQRLQPILADLVRHKQISTLTAGTYLHRLTGIQATAKILDLVRQFHRQTPESPGPALEQLRQSVAIAPAVLDSLVDMLKTDGRLVEQNGRLAAAEHRATFADEDKSRLEQVEALFRDAGFSPPSAAEVAASTQLPIAAVERLLKILREHQRLVLVEQSLLFHCDAIARARELLVDYFGKEARLESVQFKYLLDTTRKFAIPLLDYFDRVGLTRRAGNTRYLKTPLSRP